MKITQQVVGPAGESFKIQIAYLTSENRATFIQCDLNSVERPIQMRPPQRIALQSLFVSPFPVWAAQLEEIVGEKTFALIDRRDERIKDIYDIAHVLRDVTLPIDAGQTLSVYEDWRRRKRKGPPFTDLAREILAISQGPRAETEWDRVVGDLIPPPDLTTTTDELLKLMTARLGIRAIT